MRTRTMNGNVETMSGRGGRVMVIELEKDVHEVTDGSSGYVYRPIGPDMVKDVGGRLEDHSSYCDSS